MRFRFHGRWLLVAVGLLLALLAGFVAGFAVCVRSRGSASVEEQSRFLQQTGDAPPEVRAGVLAALQEFQQGYDRRDVKQIDTFMSRIFTRQNDVLILGTDADGARSYADAARFIANDWKVWGDLRLETHKTLVWSQGDVAWMTTIGAMHTPGYERPLRFSAVLEREADGWRFRNLFFQWEERSPEIGDAFRAQTYRQLGRMTVHGLTRHVRSSF